jgi:hypothetical protein
MSSVGLQQQRLQLSRGTTAAGCQLLVAMARCCIAVGGAVTVCLVGLGVLLWLSCSPVGLELGAACIHCGVALSCRCRVAGGWHVCLCMLVPLCNPKYEQCLQAACWLPVPMSKRSTELSTCQPDPLPSSEKGCTGSQRHMSDAYISNTCSTACFCLPGLHCCTATARYASLAVRPARMLLLCQTGCSSHTDTVAAC